MNICFFIGKIISDIQFEFILNSKNISICIFKIQIENNNIITIKSYNEIADKCYKDLVKGDIIGIQGYINSKMEIVIEDFEIA